MYRPDFELFEFARGEGSRFMRAFPILPCEDLERWNEQDERERRAAKFELVDVGMSSFSFLCGGGGRGCDLMCRRNFGFVELTIIPLPPFDF